MKIDREEMRKKIRKELQEELLHPRVWYSAKPKSAEELLKIRNAYAEKKKLEKKED